MIGSGKLYSRKGFVVMATYINPLSVSITLGLVLGIGLLIGVWKGYEQMKKAALWVKEKVFTFTVFFWLVNFACMAYSAQNAGYIFGLYESTGMFVGIAIDAIIIVFTQTMLIAKARGERDRAGKILLFIVFCCLFSMVGNLAHNLHTDVKNQLDNVWFSVIVPYAASLMPLLLIALAWVADLRVNPLGNADLDDYKEAEEKRLAFLDVQIENREREEQQRNKIFTIEALARRNKQIQRGRAPRSFRWFWEPPIDMALLAGEVAKIMQVHYEEQTQKTIQGIRQQVLVVENELRSSAEEMINQLREESFSQSESYRVALATQYDQDVSLVERRLQDRITTAIANFNQQINERIDGGITRVNQQVNESLTAMQSAINSRVIEEKKTATPVTNEASNSADNTEVNDDLKKLAIDYPIVLRWQSESVKSVSIEDIIKGTGLSPQRVRKAEKDGVFSGTRREGYYRVDSVIKWLKSVPLPKQKERETPGEIPAINPSNNGRNTRELDPDNLKAIA
jgi:hypothetical protein